jgi:hypothetical protein
VKLEALRKLSYANLTGGLAQLLKDVESMRN